MIKEGDNLEEVWRIVTIDDYGDKYAVSSLGRIRNNDTGQIVKPHEIKGGYLRVNLYPRGNAKHGAKRRLVHRIVAFTFLHDSYIEGVTTDVNHIDGNKHNNSVENLEWCTREHNIQYAIGMGLYDKCRQEASERFKGESNPMYGKGNRQRGGNNPCTRAIICINTGEVFGASTEASERCHCSRSGIGKVCKGEQKHYGVHPITGEKLR
jgi:hypothetical protein